MRVSAGDIKRALSKDELVFYYQPKVAFLTGQVSGAEALIRWERDDGRVIRAADLIPVAEANGLLPEITEQMFPRLLEDFQRSQAERSDATVALNISAADLDGPRLLALVQEAIERGAIDGERLQLEVTEGAVVSSSGAVMHTLASLNAAGIELSMDDYGTGFSSLETLNRLPFSEIKMDQSFTLQIMHSEKSEALVKATVAMAQMLGARTVVEGIESEAIYWALLRSGCTEGQGYWISHPLPLAEYLSFLRSGRHWPSSPVGLLRATQVAYLWQYKQIVDAVFAFLQKQRVPEMIHRLSIKHTECALGQWYHGQGRAFAGEKDFDALERPHRAMHKIYRKILAAMLKGHADRPVLEEMLEEINENCCLVSAHLQKLETKLLIGELQVAVDHSSTVQVG
jgi:EAL domain-containing protein (putative c-di-GMP-specific phosphodiesterase class I)